MLLNIDNFDNNNTHQEGHNYDDASGLDKFILIPCLKSTNRQVPELLGGFI